MSEIKALRAALESRDAQLSRQNAGLVQMARERDAAVAERDALRAELAETIDERNAAWRALHEILGKCVEGLGDSASVIVESVAVNLLRDEVKRLKATTAKVCRCVNTTYAFDPARAVVLPLAGCSITAGIGCPSCGGSGAVVVEDEA